MKAGKTKHDVKTPIRITKIAGNDSDDQELVGVTGTLTHPFPGLMVGSANKYIAGVWIAAAYIAAHGEHANLVQGDEFEIITLIEANGTVEDKDNGEVVDTRDEVLEMIWEELIDTGYEYDFVDTIKACNVVLNNYGYDELTPGEEAKYCCDTCSKVFVTFMHNCPKTSTYLEMFGCPEHDDECSFCK